MLKSMKIFSDGGNEILRELYVSLNVLYIHMYAHIIRSIIFHYIKNYRPTQGNGPTYRGQVINPRHKAVRIANQKSAVLQNEICIRLSIQCFGNRGRRRVWLE